MLTLPRWLPVAMYLESGEKATVHASTTEESKERLKPKKMLKSGHHHNALCLPFPQMNYNPDFFTHHQSENTKAADQTLAWQSAS